MYFCFVLFLFILYILWSILRPILWYDSILRPILWYDSYYGLPYFTKILTTTTKNHFIITSIGFYTVFIILMKTFYPTVFTESVILNVRLSMFTWTQARTVCVEENQKWIIFFFFVGCSLVMTHNLWVCSVWETLLRQPVCLTQVIFVQKFNLIIMMFNAATRYASYYS